MRTIEEIKKQMTDSVLDNETLCEVMSLDPTQAWEAQTSSASVLNMLLYAVAMAIQSLEWLIDLFKDKVEDRIKAAYPGTVSWYWNRALEFQDGHDINGNGGYDTDDPGSRIIKYCAVTEEYDGVKVKVSKDGYDPLDNTDPTDSELQRFADYMNRIKFAGTRLSVSSVPSDTLELGLRIWRKPLMTLTEDEVKTSVQEYLDGIRYGGVFNKTKLIDHLQRMEAIDDVAIFSCKFEAADGTTTNLMDGNLNLAQNYYSYAGHIVLDEFFSIDWRQ